MAAEMGLTAAVTRENDAFCATVRNPGGESAIAILAVYRGRELCDVAVRSFAGADETITLAVSAPYPEMADCTARLYIWDSWQSLRPMAYTLKNADELGLGTEIFGVRYRQVVRDTFENGIPSGWEAVPSAVFPTCTAFSDNTWLRLQKRDGMQPGAVRRFAPVCGTVAISCFFRAYDAHIKAPLRALDSEGRTVAALSIGQQTQPRCLYVCHPDGTAVALDGEGLCVLQDDVAYKLTWVLDLDQGTQSVWLGECMVLQNAPLWQTADNVAAVSVMLEGTWGDISGDGTWISEYPLYLDDWQVGVTEGR